MTILNNHIFHPYEDMNLTFRDLKEIIQNIGSGKNIDCFEKFDGINILFTWDLNADELRFARNKTHIKQGGLSKIFLEPEFSDRPDLFKCLNDLYDILSQAFQKLDFRIKSNIFGSMGGGIWYSVEILTPNLFNTLKYDNKSVIFHQNGNSMYNLKGEPLDIDLTINYGNMITLIPTLNTNIENTGWVLCPPTKIPIRPLDEQTVKGFVKDIDNLISQYQITPHTTIQDFIQKRMINELIPKFPLIHNTIKSFVIKNILNVRGAIPMEQIISGLDPTIIDQINQMVKEAKIVKEQIVSPLEKIIYDFSVLILKDLKSAFINDYKEELERLKKELNRCLGVITNNNDLKSQSILQRNTRKLQSINHISTTMEGIVFKHRNKLYKLTGCFAPINQICAHVKYNLERTPVEKKNIKILKPSLFKASK